MNRFVIIKNMFKKYKLMPNHKKNFALLTALVIAVTVGLYIFNVSAALSMDKNSYNCTGDSMMSNICMNPFGSSITWTLLNLAIYCWPLLLAWLISGVVSENKSSK
jgi:uncharacterized membrane protein YczE